ncbi:tRNA A37 methylthiotransferase MiaB [Amycolatopsis lexingtonensis]|uniref:tRNA A37 methylthiotransferase MiaB n=1 Tax=Amycolatopsis lexingtonensis TaxID=218822 RepID=A0ABR9HQE2_9PSEU|nr:tRNA A37 methylthiotransferase MiaB [Amycolatopsis lexingtonensis]
MPALRGKERDRRHGEILAEVEALVAEGVLEVTLLGQNVNSYGIKPARLSVTSAEDFVVTCRASETCRCRRGRRAS